MQVTGFFFFGSMFVLVSVNDLWINTGRSKCNAIPEQALRVPGVWGSQISRQPALEASKTVKPTYDCFWVSVDPRATLRPEWMSTKNSIDPIGNRTHDLSACGAVPTPTTSPQHRLIRTKFVAVTAILWFTIGNLSQRNFEYWWHFSFFKERY